MPETGPIAGAAVITDMSVGDVCLPWSDTGAAHAFPPWASIGAVVIGGPLLVLGGKRWRSS